jgi:hypothetical protein
MSEYKNDKKKENKCSLHSMKRMLSLMVLCCGLPILLIVLLPFLNIGISFSLISMLLFLCPIMMLFMIPMMLKGSKEGKSGQDEEKHL